MANKPSLHLKLFTEEERHGLATVANSFKRGLEGLNVTVKEVVTKKSANIATLTQNIEVIASNFRNAADEARGIRETLYKRLTLLAKERSGIEDNLRDTRFKRGKLQTTLRAYEDELQKLRDQLQDAEDAYESSRGTLQIAENEFEQKKAEQTAVRIAGTAAFAIPVLGWVLGPTLLAVSETAPQENVNSAKENLQEANNLLQDKINRIEEKAKAIEKEKNKIKTIDQDIDRLQKNKNEIQEKFRNCQEKFEKQTGVCTQLQECQRLMSTTVGRGENIRDQIKFYDVQPFSWLLKNLAIQLTPESSIDFLECSAFENFHRILMAIASEESSGVHAIGLSMNATVTMTNKEILQHLNCEHFLVPAPLALAIFGQVCTISLKKDFSIEVPREGFEFLKWINSFRANLQEIRHAVNSTSETAHVNANTEALPIHLSQILEMLHKFDNSFGKCFLNCMGIITENSGTWLSLSKGTDDTYVEIIETLTGRQDCSINVSLCNIGRYWKGTSPGTTMANMKITMLNNQVTQADCLLSCLTNIAGTYTHVSTEFSLPVTEQLRGLLESTSSDSMIKADLHSFKEKFSDIQKEIENTIQKNQAMLPSSHVFFLENKR